MLKNRFYVWKFSCVNDKLNMKKACVVYFHTFCFMIISSLTFLIEINDGVSWVGFCLLRFSAFPSKKISFCVHGKFHFIQFECKIRSVWCSKKKSSRFHGMQTKIDYVWSALKLLPLFTITQFFITFLQQFPCAFPRSWLIFTEQINEHIWKSDFSI